MGDVVKLTRGRQLRGKKIPKPVECRECGEDVETARVQALMTHGFAMAKPPRCLSCQRAWERRFERQMEGVRAHQTVQIIDR